MNGTTPPSKAVLAEYALSVYRDCPVVSHKLRGVLVNPIDDPTHSESYLGGRDVMAFTVPNTTTGVIYLSTMHPTPDTAACYERFVIDLVYALRNLSSVDNILIDTSNNPGGHSQLSQLAQILFRPDPLHRSANGEASRIRNCPTEKSVIGGSSTAVSR